MKFKFTLHKIILSLIPYFLIYYFKKKVSANYALFGKAKTNAGHYLLNDTKTTFTVYGMESELGATVIKGFYSCYQDYISRKNLLRKYVLSVDNCIIEPTAGWGILAANDTLVFDSISNNAWREAYHPSYITYKKNKAGAISYPEIVSINIIGGGDNNYWHFLHDLLGQVALAKKVLPQNLPFLVSKRLSNKSFFKEALLQSPFLAGCTWLIRDKYYMAGKAYFLQTMPNSNEQFFDVRKMLLIKNSDKTRQRKIFLKRNKNRIRHIKNSAEIETIARQNNFEIIDADYLSLQQQIELFGETQLLVGIHGAGLTNVIYRKNASLHLLEILPADYLQPHYFWLSKGMEHTYRCVVGSPSAYDTSFYVDPQKFKEKLFEMLNSNFKT